MRRSCRRQTQQALRRHHDQRPLNPGLDLPSQQMEILRGRRRITNLEIVLRAKLEITLEARARMFRSLAFVTMRQQHHEPRRLLPLVFRSRDVLIDDRLRAVAEVAKLRFPQKPARLDNDEKPYSNPSTPCSDKRTVKHVKPRLRICSERNSASGAQVFPVCVS